LDAEKVQYILTVQALDGPRTIPAGQNRVPGGNVGVAAADIAPSLTTDHKLHIRSDGVIVKHIASLKDLYHTQLCACDSKLKFVFYIKIPRPIHQKSVFRGCQENRP
jgi:hypothetical protein